MNNSDRVRQFLKGRGWTLTQDIADETRIYNQRSLHTALKDLRQQGLLKERPVLGCMNKKEYKLITPQTQPGFDPGEVVEKNGKNQIANKIEEETRSEGVSTAQA